MNDNFLATLKVKNEFSSWSDESLTKSQAMLIEHYDLQLKGKDEAIKKLEDELEVKKKELSALKPVLKQLEEFKRKKQRK